MQGFLRCAHRFRSSSEVQAMMSLRVRYVFAAGCACCTIIMLRRDIGDHQLDRYAVTTTTEKREICVDLQYCNPPGDYDSSLGLIFNSHTVIGNK